jgi:CDP-diacylglycerol--serine O-phosphatidyltransferase
MIPNILTTLALCAGLTALRFALEGRFENAVGALVVAGLLDMFDGRVARLLKQTSNFGAQLDTLSDFLSFGVVPAAMLYMSSLNELGLAGWALALVFCVCCALRLARFNAELAEPRRVAEARNYFVGVPSPAGAGIVLMPLVISFYGTDAFSVVFGDPLVVAGFVVVVSGLMVSQLPTFSLKRIHIPPHYRIPTMLGVAIFTAAAVSEPWPTLTFLLVVYAVSLPFAWYSYQRLLQRIESAQAESGNDDKPTQTAVPLTIVNQGRK